MIDFSQLARLDFKDESAFGTLDSILGEVATFAETRTAAEIASNLQKRVDADSSLQARLGLFIAKFRVLALPVLTDQQAAAVFSTIGQILSDERIGVYERLRARFIVLPQSRQKAFADLVMSQLHGSRETLGSMTIGEWVTSYEQSGAGKNAESFFTTGPAAQIEASNGPALRHLIHVITLLQNPTDHIVTPVQRSTPPTAPMPKVPSDPVSPPNLPVATPTPMPVRPVTPPTPVPATPSVAAVVARLHQTNTGMMGSSAPSEHMTPEDEQEIEGHTQHLASLDAGPNVHDTIAETIDGMIQKLSITFGEENLKRRFITVMTSRLKDIRTSNETMDVLTRAVKVGGLGFEQGLAERVVQEAAQAASQFKDEASVKALAEEQKKKMEAPMPKPPKVPSAPQLDLASLQPKPAPMAMPSTPTIQPMAAPSPRSMRPNPSLAPSAFRPAEMMSAEPMGVRTATEGRPSMSDIRGTSRLTGPVEELRQMSLSDYHRLGPDPVSVIRRVYEKIQRLGKESFTRRAEGITAWRGSEVYKLYLTMGHESLASGKSVRDVSFARQQQGQPTLTDDEFMLIADLNRKLRF